MRGSSFIVSALLTVSGAPAIGQPSSAPRLTVSGTHRVRYEMISGQVRPGFGRKDDLLNFRTTLLAEYRDGPVTLAAELWDSRVYGADRNTPVSTNEVNTVEPVQVYAIGQFGTLLGPGTSATVQAGRFMLNLGSRRLVAADDYRNTTNGYTGVRADLNLGRGWRSTLVYTLPQQRRPDDAASLADKRVELDRESFDLVLWGGLLSKAEAIGTASLEGGFFHLRDRDAPRLATRDRSLDTASVRLIREPGAGHLDFETELIGQRGRAAASTAPGAPVLPVCAWFAHADIGYTFAGGWRPRVSVEYDHASGDRAGGRYGRFDTLFGMRRADLAPSGLYNAIARTNISSPGIRLEAAPRPGTDMMLSARSMWAAARTDSFSSTGVRDASGRAGRFAGSQIDGRLRHRLTRALLLEIDGVVLRKGRLLRDAPNAPPGRWTTYLSLNALVAFP